MHSERNTILSNVRTLLLYSFLHSVFHFPLTINFKYCIYRCQCLRIPLPLFHYMQMCLLRKSNRLRNQLWSVLHIHHLILYKIVCSYKAEIRHFLLFAHLTNTSYEVLLLEILYSEIVFAENSIDMGRCIKQSEY